MRCSAGSPVTYKLWLDYQGAGQAPVYWGSLSRYWTLSTNPGTYNIRVEVVDAAGRSSMVMRPVTIQ